MTEAPPDVQLVEVDASNWRAVAAVRPHPNQGEFVAPVVYYLCLSHYGGQWHPLAVERDGSILGHVMWAVDDEDGSVWLGGFVIDATAQSAGVGRAAVNAFLERFAEDGQYNIALSVSPENSVARHLYSSIGFVETGEMDDDEIVLRLQSSR